LSSAVCKKRGSWSRGEKNQVHKADMPNADWMTHKKKNLRRKKKTLSNENMITKKAFGLEMPVSAKVRFASSDYT
jgi:hypothetical protein